MYDSITTLLQLLDSAKQTEFITFKIDFVTNQIHIFLNKKLHWFKYTQEGITKAIEELEYLTSKK